MAYVIQRGAIGDQAITETSTTKNHPLGTIIQAQDPDYGNAEFIYLLGVASTVARNAVIYNPDDFSTTLLAAGEKAIRLASYAGRRDIGVLSL